jgi:hypothetical protein
VQIQEESSSGDWRLGAVYSWNLLPLAPLTRLHTLLLDSPRSFSMTAADTTVLGGMQQLTQLRISSACGYRSDRSRGTFEPGALAGHTKLQHLELGCSIPGQAAAPGVAALLSQLQPLTQLTKLVLRDAMLHAAPTAAAYSTLTASSKLQVLELRGECQMPAGAWQYILPVGRQLPHLRQLLVAQSDRTHSVSDVSRPAPDVALLASSCPSLQETVINGASGTGSWAALTSLTGLTLKASNVDRAGVQALAQLTWLKSLYLLPLLETGALRPLAQLQQLTSLDCRQLKHYGFRDMWDDMWDDDVPWVS